MEYKLAMKILGTTNILKTFYLFVVWILKPQIAVDLAKNIALDIKNHKSVNENIIAIGYLNEFFSKYIEFGKSNEEIVKLNETIDKKGETKSKILRALIELRRIRLEVKKLNRDKVDQLVETPKSFGISSGSVSGKVLNITSTKQLIPKGCIGIFPTSGTKYTAQFLKCAGIIFLNGSVTSHGSILARENKIPAIVSQNLRIDNNEHVLINGSTGEIKLVDMGN